MDRRRISIFVLGPLPIIATSFAISHWLKREASGPITGNHVLHAQDTNIRRPTAAASGTAGNGTTAGGEVRNLEADCLQAAEQLRTKLGKECAVVVRAPYLIAGDMPEKELIEWHDKTIAAAARALTTYYFQKTPNAPITVLLFINEKSYNHYAKQLFNEEGISVYGYYKADRRTLVMNVGTGGGTLVHELTHALLDFDFPKVPDWFNEGLASLYEQSQFLPNDQGIEGLPNWRLPGLQEAIRKQRLGSLEHLIRSDDFRGPLVGLNYAQARYFCLYLQERKLLQEFYRRFRTAHEKDPRGLQTVRELFGDERWQQIDRDFQAWALALQY
ncbi:MAG: DUF1570 domain-containing protein [Planctomycetia bacterium]|nr:DUF1570 domain-containing protein [Planctomycetia bacterium]